MKVIRKKVIIANVDPDYLQVINAIKFIFYQLYDQSNGNYTAGKRARKAIRLVKKKLHERLMISLNDMKTKESKRKNEDYFYKEFQKELELIINDSNDSLKE